MLNTLEFSIKKEATNNAMNYITFYNFQKPSLLVFVTSSIQKQFPTIMSCAPVHTSCEQETQYFSIPEQNITRQYQSSQLNVLTKSKTIFSLVQ